MAYAITGFLLFLSLFKIENEASRIRKDTACNREEILVL